MAKKKIEEEVKEVATELLYDVKFKCNVVVSPKLRYDRGSKLKLTKKEIEPIKDCIEYI